MAKSFEELGVWQKTLILVKEIYALTNNEKFRKDFSLTDQIRRAGISILANIAEGFERGSNTEFIQFLYIAKGSSGEVRSQLYVAYELGYIDKETFYKYLLLCKEISGQLSRLISYLKRSRFKGEKFKVNYKSMREEVEEILKKIRAKTYKS